MEHQFIHGPGNYPPEMTEGVAASMGWKTDTEPSAGSERQQEARAEFRSLCQEFLPRFQSLEADTLDESETEGVLQEFILRLQSLKDSKLNTPQTTILEASALLIGVKSFLSVLHQPGQTEGALNYVIHQLEQALSTK